MSTSMSPITGGKARARRYNKHVYENCAFGSRRNARGGCTLSPCNTSPYCGRFRTQNKELVNHSKHSKGLSVTQYKAKMKQLKNTASSSHSASSSESSRSRSKHSAKKSKRVQRTVEERRAIAAKRAAAALA